MNLPYKRNSIRGRDANKTPWIRQRDDRLFKIDLVDQLPIQICSGLYTMLCTTYIIRDLFVYFVFNFKYIYICVREFISNNLMTPSILVYALIYHVLALLYNMNYIFVR